MTSPAKRAIPIAAAAAAVLLVGFGAYSCSKRGGDDRLSDSQARNMSVAAAADSNTAATSATTASPARRCSSGATYDLFKRELFRRAAEIRGKADPALFDRIATAAALRVERPVVTSADEGLGSIACAATATLDLPPGLAVAGGRTRLSANLAYTLQPAADASGDVLVFTNADAITVPLATIGRSPAVTAQSGPGSIPSVPAIAPARPNSAPPPVPSTPPPLATPPTRPIASPSFACSNARTSGGLLICNDPGLSAIDRQMAAQYREAYAAASPDARDILRGTAQRFYGFRDNCPTARCVADGYRARMREIDDVMRHDQGR